VTADERPQRPKLKQSGENQIMKTLTTILLGAIAAIGLAGAAQTPSTKPAPAPAAKTAPAAKPATATKLVDINTASVDQLKALPGIDDATAQKIVAGRPYKGRNELLNRKIVSADEYSKIKFSIKARQPKTATTKPPAAATKPAPVAK
jgi:DNA uptake protein ComE-like DNA-binding protein